jgi:hypothetical protein
MPNDTNPNCYQQGGVGLRSTSAYFRPLNFNTEVPIVTRTDIADAMRKLEAHEREHVTEKSHVLGHSDTVDAQVAKGRIIN